MPPSYAYDDCWRMYYYQWNGVSSAREYVWDCNYWNPPSDYWQETVAIIIIICSFLPFKVLMLLIAGCGGCQHGGCGNTCCSSENSNGCCGSRGCWACTNLIFGVLSLLMDFSAMILLFYWQINSWWLLCIFILSLTTATHFRVYGNLCSAPRGGAAHVQFQGVPQNQHAPGQSVGAVQYCPFCAGPLMMPAPAPPTVACPHCQRLISSALPVAVPTAVQAMPELSPYTPPSYALISAAAMPMSSLPAPAHLQVN